jgi:SRSO17 transposase
MTTLLATADQISDDVDDLSAFCRELFGSMARSDQRRWGEVYLRGLTAVPGRKTIRQISDHVVGEPVDQCLQQFVNQSPWRWEPVREALAHRAAAIRPLAWMFREVVFPKTGTSSVGVAKQYTPSAGRVLNCQVGLAAVLVGQGTGCVANWRLMLPRTWDDDPRRRVRTRIPDTERHLPRWRHILQSIDEMTIKWGLRPAPIILDARDGDAQQVLRSLTERGLPYLVRVSAHTPMPAAGSAGSLATAGQFAARAARRQIILPGPAGRGRRPVVVHYSVASVCDTCLVRQPISGCPHGRTRRLIAEWTPDGHRLRALWLANLVRAYPHQLVNLATLDRIPQQVMTTLRDEFGLQDFEGRSFAGWHHHVTLVSAAHTFATLRRMSTVAGGCSGQP